MPTTADYPARQTLRLSTYKTQIPGLYLGDTALVGSLFLHILNETREVAKFLHSWRETHHAALLPPPSHLLRQTCFFSKRSARRWQIQRQRFCTTEKLSTTTSVGTVLGSLCVRTYTRTVLWRHHNVHILPRRVPRSKAVLGPRDYIAAPTLLQTIVQCFEYSNTAECRRGTVLCWVTGIKLSPISYYCWWSW